MSYRYQGGFIRPGYNPLRVPNAPTIGTASSSTGTTASVPFTAPSCVGGSAITGYTAVSSPGCKVGTGSASPITVNCLTTGTAYTFRVYATNSYGPSAYSAASNSVTPVAIGQQAYTTAGTYSWVAPAGVTSVSVVAVGGGANNFCASISRSGPGGGLGYKNNIAVTPGNSYSVVVGAGAAINSVQNGGDSYFINTSTVKGGGGNVSCRTNTVGGTYVGDGGGNGGATGGNQVAGGGAGGYAGNGGNGATNYGCGAAGSGGGGGGGGQGVGCCYVQGASGGGVGILGQGANGAGGTGSTGAAPTGGGGGSGGASGSWTAAGGLYGGGSGVKRISGSSATAYGGGGGAVRIIWPGTTRSFPSTNTGNL